MDGNELDRLDEELVCPVCGEPTRNLKQYRYMRWCVFYLAGAAFQVNIIRACPACMRRKVWTSALINIIPANLIWLVLLLPWALVLTLMSLVEGHSKAVLQGVTPAMAIARETRGNELNMNRVWAVLSILLSWLPLIGLICGAIAWYVNRRATNWTRPVSMAGFFLACLFHLALVGLVLWESIRWQL